MDKVSLFSQVPTIDIDRNLFERNHSWKGTLDGGVLVPVFFDEVLPGDTLKLNTTFFGRMSTPIVPIMDNIYLDYHLWFVPRRLTWEHFKNFMGERKNPNDSIDYLVPTISAGEDGFARYSNYDYMSLPPVIPNYEVDAQYFRSLALIWNEWYRDQNFQDSIDIPMGDGPDDKALYSDLLPRGKRQDYFTTALPQPQKGAAVDLPLSGDARVITTANPTWLNAVDNGSSNGAYGPINRNNSNSAITMTYSGTWKYGNETNLIADLSSVNSATINSLRQAFALQQFLETDNIYGSLYVNIVLGHFGVRVPDYRLQRPEYLGGGTSMINITPVAQTSSSDSTTPQGNLGAFATIASTGNGFAQSFQEHGIIIGLVSIRTDLNYQQGVDRCFLRQTRYDFYFPTLAHIGDQGIYNMELYVQGNADDKKIFGYNERYSEYRYKNNYITSKFRSTDPQSLDTWHLAQKFDSLPTLSEQFIVENPPFDRVIAVQDEPQFLLDVWHEYDCIRPVALYGTPGLRRM